MQWNSVDRCDSRLRAVKGLLGGERRRIVEVENVLKHWPTLAHDLCGRPMDWVDQCNLYVEVVDCTKEPDFLAGGYSKKTPKFFFLDCRVRRPGDNDLGDMRLGDVVITISKSGEITDVELLLTNSIRRPNGTVFTSIDCEADQQQLLDPSLPVAQRREVAETCDLTLALLAQLGVSKSWLMR